MGYVQKGSLTALFDSKSVAPVGRAIADNAGSSFTRLAAAATPKRTGRTAEAWEQIPVHETHTEAGLGAWVSGTRNPHYVARFLEFGVEAHDVSPKGGDDGAHAVSTPEGPRAHARTPGFGGVHMAERAAVEVEAALPAIAQPSLEAWAAALEASADSGAKAKP